MLQIVKQENKDNYIDIIRGLGIDPESAQVSESLDSGKVTGYAVYEFSGDSVVIHDIEAGGDLMLFDGIARSVLFLAALKGNCGKAVERAVFGEQPRQIANKLGLAGENGVLEPISDIFNKCESCCAY